MFLSLPPKGCHHWHSQSIHMKKTDMILHPHWYPCLILYADVTVIPNTSPSGPSLLPSSVSYDISSESISPVPTYSRFPCLSTSKEPPDKNDPSPSSPQFFFCLQILVWYPTLIHQNLILYHPTFFPISQVDNHPPWYQLVIQIYILKVLKTILK